MSTPNARVSIMIARSSGSSGGWRSYPADNISIGGTIAHASSNRGRRHGYLANNAKYNRRISHCDPEYSVSTAGTGKPKTIYIKKNQYPISIVQLAEVLEITWRNKAGFDILTLGGFPQWRTQRVRFNCDC